MNPGIYEEIISKSLKQRLANIDSTRFYVCENGIDKAEAAKLLTRYIASILYRILKDFNGDLSLQNQLVFCNDLLLFIDQKLSDIDLSNNIVDIEGKILNAILSKIGSTDNLLNHEILNITPKTGLTTSTLFTGSSSEISLDSEIEKEILSSDRIYWIVSFIRWSGVRIFEDSLKKFTSKKGNEFKIITTCYMGASQPKAIEFLSSLPNTEIKISYNTNHERLHAKSYIFERESSFDTAYIGSSNLSHSALTKGTEWNLKTTSKENQHIIDKAKGTFLAYWNNPDFEEFKIGGIEKFKKAIRSANQKNEDSIIANFRISPYPFQNEILEKLEVERVIHGSFKNLLVAATGIGKTVIAAFDYKRFKLKNQTQSNLLFIAHREEIIKQSQASFCGILNDPDFGELWVGKDTPESYDHLFISIQTFNSNIEFFKERFTSDYYDFIIIDEVHHISADSYRPILQLFDPKILLGLTATPERMDGQWIASDFNNRIAAETRLPDALRMGLLSPFQYFCVTDDTANLRTVRWANGKYDSNELVKLYTLDDTRLRLILQTIEKYLTDIDNTKALCFCVNKSHAMYMADKFKKYNLKAEYIISEPGRDAELRRKTIRQKLVMGELNFVFSVDIFNEGIDIPEINTVLFLRPTESLTIFLQQLGRGLRLAENKECLTVLDFVSQANERYNYAEKFRSLIGKTNHSIDKEISQGFPHLPFGCAIKMEQKAQKYILANITSAIFDLRRLRREIATFENNSHKSLNLSNFTDFFNLNIRTIYKGQNCWHTLKSEAFNLRTHLTEKENVISRNLKRLTHIDSPRYLSFIEELLKMNFKIGDVFLKENLQFLTMLYYDLWQKPFQIFGFVSIKDAFAEIGKHNWITNEISEIIESLRNHIIHLPFRYEPHFKNVLEVHASYTRDELLAHFNLSTFEKAYNSQEGVIRIKDINTELLLVTLNKSDRDFSPSTMYEDYAINESMFHWQSQNSIHPDSPVGKSYIEHRKIGKTLLMFVREHKKDEFGFTMPYTFLGPVNYNNHNGSYPMNITWQLQEAMPANIYKASAKMMVG